MYYLLISLLLFQTHIPFRELKYSDFRGHGKEAAHTTTEINLDEEHENGRYRFFVTCWFLPDESWINVKTPEVLSHENLHFSISWLYCLRIRKATEKFQGCDSLTYIAVSKYYDHEISEWRNEQAELDFATGHGVDSAAERQYAESISNQLKQVK